MLDWHRLSMHKVSTDKSIDELGKHLGKLMTFLINIGTKPSEIHVIGCGTGTEIAASAGKYVKGVVGRYRVYDRYKYKLSADFSTLIYPFYFQNHSLESLTRMWEELQRKLQ